MNENFDNRNTQTITEPQFGNFVMIGQLQNRKAGRFASMDMALFSPRYITMGPQAKILYTLIMHHAVMSAADPERWSDQGRVFVKLSQKDLAYAIGGIGRDGDFRPADTKTVRKSLEILEAYGLIVTQKCAPIRAGKNFKGQTSKIFPLWPVIDEDEKPEHWTISMMVPDEPEKVKYTVPDLEEAKAHKIALEHIKRATMLEAARLSVERAEEKLEADGKLQDAINRVSEEYGIADDLSSVTVADIAELERDPEYRRAKDVIKNCESTSADRYRAYTHDLLDQKTAEIRRTRWEMDRELAAAAAEAEAEREEQEAAEAAYYGEAKKDV